MSEQENKSAPNRDLIFWGVVFACLLGLLALVAIPVRTGPYTSRANACINNLRQIDGAKHSWALEHNARPGAMVTTNDVAPFLRPETLTCPSGGIYNVGKISEPPTCSLSNTVTPAHVLP